MSDENLFYIEKAKINYLEKVKEIELECGLSNWSLFDYRQEIERTDSIFYVCSINGQIAGFILARLIMLQVNILTINKKRKKILNSKNLYSNVESSNLNSKYISETESENEVEIYNIGVGKNYRRKSIGTYLFQSLLETSRQNSVKKIWLEVRTSNGGAIKFYESEGFKIAGTRRNLFTNPSEDGFTMCLDI